MVKAWEDTITIPTYERGPEDPNPPLLMRRRNPIHPGSCVIYPYPLQETLFNRKTDRKWRIFYLENEYLKLGVLPDLGGRMSFLFDKSTGGQAIYHNRVLKWARIGIRGAWVSGGIEWNFPNGHTVTNSSPVDCAVRANPDGSRSLLFGDTERVSRMRWSVAVSLHPGRAFVQTEMRLANRTLLPNRYWFWANSAAPVGKGMEYISTATKVFTLQARALQKLGQRGPAGKLLDGLLDWARKGLEQGRGESAENHYLAGLALKGQGQRVRARRHFQEALAAEPGHRRAAWEARGFSLD